MPKGERLLWQGRPDAWALAIRVFHIRLVAAYFALLFVVRIAMRLSAQEPWGATMAGAARLAIPFAIAMVLLGGLAWLYGRTTRYSITSRRVLLQFGAVLPMTLNVPFGEVASAAVKTYGDDTGDLPLAVTSKQRLAFLLLWPHVRPWHLTRVEPMLRCVPAATKVAEILGAALAQASSATPEPADCMMPLPRPAQPVVATAA
ncbi:photosynthetic complex putative assembly protein PuhB [Bradyrhizobium jicamae]|uniref:photosynthetic complex putative assembly protein PuhB n=1 Tax=Bradyrhizobium jicamae TaxID=280332 RepID=UPI0028982AD5|nr:photosynthetic complex putative assembly protein PuhB [Bradyrhizobium jicamae]